MDHSSVQKIIVRMPNWIGDIVMATPFIHEVRKFYPKAHLTVMCQYPGSDLLLQDPSIDELFAFKRSKPLFMRRDPQQSITERLKIGHYDLGFLLTNSWSSAWWFFQGGVKERVGFKNGLRQLLLTRCYKKPPKESPIHQVDEYRILLGQIAKGASAMRPILYLDDQEKREAERLLNRLGIEQKDTVIGISPGASYGSAKCWPVEYFVDLVKRLKAHPTVKVIFLGDAGQEPMIASIIEQTASQAINLAGKTSLRELMAIIQAVDLLLTNDSGPMHIAAALQKPLIALFGSTDPRKTGPYRADQVLYHPAACSPCFKRECPIDFRCMRSLTPDLVDREIAKQLHLER